MDQRLFHAMTLWTRYGSAKDPSNNEKLTEVNSIDTNRRVYMMCDDFIRTRSICTHIVRDHLYVLRETHRKKYDSNAQLRNIRGLIGRLRLQWPDFRFLQEDLVILALFEPQGTVNLGMAIQVIARLSGMCGAFWDVIDKGSSAPWASIEAAFQRSVTRYPIDVEIPE